MNVNKLFTISCVHISKSKRCFSVKSSTNYFHMKTKILVDFQICISVPFKAFSKSNTFFSVQPPWCLTSSWVELQILVRSCLIHINVILKHFLYLVCFCACRSVVLFMSYPCYLFFIFLFIIINHIVSLKEAYFLYFLLIF